jgi:hypothetical protein
MDKRDAQVNAQDSAHIYEYIKVQRPREERIEERIYDVVADLSTTDRDNDNHSAYSDGDE